MKALKTIENIIKVLVMLVIVSSIIVFYSFGLRFVTEIAIDLSYTVSWIAIFKISFTIIYSFISWLLFMVLGYVLFRKDKK